MITLEAIQNIVDKVKSACDGTGRFTVCCSQEMEDVLRKEFPNVEVVVFPKNSGVDDKVFLIRHRDRAGEFI